MQKEAFYKWAKEIANKNNFKVKKKIYEADYYTRGNLRNVIYSGILKNKPAVLKVYDDPRPSIEPISLKAFNKINQSKKLIAPKLYAYNTVSLHKGWLIMEQLPNDGYFFTSPLSPEKRKEFLKVYLEYKKHFPKNPTRKLMLAENLRADEFHLFRIGRWLELANNKEMELEMKGKRTFLNTKLFLPLYSKALLAIQKEFKGRKMQWIHGHFKPKEIFFYPKSNIYYLTDFAHSHLFPEGYELGFIIWADHILTESWRLPYEEFRDITYAWIENLYPIARILEVKKAKNLIKVCVIERLIGYILADVCASDRPDKEKRVRLDYSIRLLGELLK